LLEPGDTIALAAPIFTPYLEIPNMSDYQLEVVHIRADKNQNWQYPTIELDKLRDPKVIKTLISKIFIIYTRSKPSFLSIRAIQRR
jgi:aspartate/methionine/tyrosine aminotransferase